MNAADTAWIIVATALVLFMTLPGLALFYGGLVRARNVLSVFMQCFGIACLMSVLWLAFGYSIAFGSGTSGYWGGLSHMFLSGVDASTVRDGTTLPEVLFFAFQMTFAIITPASNSRRVCGADWFWVRDDIFRALDAPVLCACCPLGLGRRYLVRWRPFRRDRLERFCRRCRGA